MSAIADLAVKLARCDNETARAGLYEQLREALVLEPWPTGGPHSFILHQAPMHCETCGRVTTACECKPDEMRAWKCLDCGFRVVVGGRSISDMIAGPPRDRPS